MPPPVSHSGRSLISTSGAIGERGYQVGTIISPIYDLNIETAYSESYSRGGLTSSYLADKYAGVRWTISPSLTVSSYWERIDQTTKDEIETHFDGYYYLDRSHTVSLTAYVKRFIPYIGEDYHEKHLVLGISRANQVQVSVGGSTSNHDGTDEPKKLGFVELTIRFKGHELIVFNGGERGGLVCSSGMCQQRPTFQGTRVILFSRF